MKFNFNIHYNTLFKFILALVFLNTASVNAEKLDLGPFEGKLSGILIFATDKSYEDFQLVELNLTTGNLNINRDFKSPLGQSILAEPEISNDKKHVLFSGYSENNNTPRSEIYKLDLKSKKLSIWSKSKLNLILPRYSKNDYKLAFTKLNNSNQTKNIIYDFKTDSFNDLPCLTPFQCVMPNWDKTSHNIVYLNDKSRILKSINIKSNKITKLYEVKNKDFIIHPSYTFDNNIIFTKQYVPNKTIQNSSISIINKITNKTSIIYSQKDYILNAITLNDERYIVFVTKEFKNQSKLTIYDRETKQQVSYSKKLRSISPAVWQP